MRTPSSSPQTIRYGIQSSHRGRIKNTCRQGRGPETPQDAVLKLYRQMHPEMSPSELLIEITTDSNFWVRSVLLAERKAAKGKAPVYSVFCSTGERRCSTANWMAPHADRRSVRASIPRSTRSASPATRLPRPPSPPPNPQPGPPSRAPVRPTTRRSRTGPLIRRQIGRR